PRGRSSPPRPARAFRCVWSPASARTATRPSQRSAPAPPGHVAGRQGEALARRPAPGTGTWEAWPPRHGGTGSRAASGSTSVSGHRGPLVVTRGDAPAAFGRGHNCPTSPDRPTPPRAIEQHVGRWIGAGTEQEVPPGPPAFPRGFRSNGPVVSPVPARAGLRARERVRRPSAGSPTAHRFPAQPRASAFLWVSFSLTAAGQPRILTGFPIKPLGLEAHRHQHAAEAKGAAPEESTGCCPHPSDAPVEADEDGAPTLLVGVAVLGDGARVADVEDAGVEPEVLQRPPAQARVEEHVGRNGLIAALLRAHILAASVDREVAHDLPVDLCVDQVRGPVVELDVLVEIARVEQGVVRRELHRLNRPHARGGL